MNSILEVSKNIIAILGSEKPSEFRLNQLRQTISLEEAKNITYKEIFFCHLNILSSAISNEELSELSQLLNGAEEEDARAAVPHDDDGQRGDCGGQDAHFLGADER